MSGKKTMFLFGLFIFYCIKLGLKPYVMTKNCKMDIILSNDAYLNV